MLSLERRLWNAGYHPPEKDRTRLAMGELRAVYIDMIEALHAYCPASRELERALDALEDSEMLAIASLARNEDPMRPE